MDLLANPKGLVRLWTCLMSDYECLLHQFVAQRGYTFSHFAKRAMESHITLLHHNSVTHGRKRDVHHEVIGQIILNTAKDLWLHPGNLICPYKEGNKLPGDDSEEIGGGTSAKGQGAEHVKDVEETWKTKIKELFQFGLNGEDVVLKYQVGAFFLTYVMYDRQPYAGLLKICIDPKDFEQFMTFQANVMKWSGMFLPDDVAKECRFILHKLQCNYAFTITGLSDTYDVSGMARSLLNVKHDEMVKLFKSDKIIMDCLAHSLVSVHAPARFKDYMMQKHHFLKKTELPAAIAIGKAEDQQYGCFPHYPAICVGKSGLENDTQNVNSDKSISLLSTLESAHGIGEVVTSSAVLQEMASKPVFTAGSLLGSDIASKVFMTEATKRLKRLHIIAEKQSEGSGTGRGRAKVAKKPYKNEDGVFGRVKGNQMAEEDGKVPTRMKASYHLWNYIKGKGYQADSKNSEFGMAMSNGKGEIFSVQQEKENPFSMDVDVETVPENPQKKMKFEINNSEDGEAPETMQLMLDEEDSTLTDDLDISDPNSSCSE